MVFPDPKPNMFAKIGTCTFMTRKANEKCVVEY